MRRWVLFVARRHVRNRRRERGNATTIFAVLGIAAGAMTLVAVLSVMNGFQLGTIEDILEIDSYHLRIDDAGDPAALAAQISERSGVQAAVPFLDAEVLATGFFRDLQAIRVRALAGDVGRRDAGFRRAFEMVSGVFDIEGEQAIVLGVELARGLGVSPGDEVELVSLEGADLSRGSTVALRVSGVFRSGYLDFDRSWAFVSLETARGALGAGGTPTIGVKLADRYNDIALQNALQGALPPSLEISSWRDYNRSIFGALRLEKNLMTVLIGLIFLVVAGNMLQSLRRSVVERAEEIAILKALGAPPRSIQLIFVGEGAIIGLLGGGIGVGLGLLIAGNVNGIFRITETVINALLGGLGRLLGSVTGGSFSIFSPRYFYITEVPVEILPGEVLGIFLFAFVIAGLAALLASVRVSRIRPAEVLRNE